jgi:hypothetical protein
MISFLIGFSIGLFILFVVLIIKEFKNIWSKLNHLSIDYELFKDDYDFHHKVKNCPIELKCSCGHVNPWIPDCEECGNKL